MRLNINKVVIILWLSFFTLIFTSPFPVQNPGFAVILLLVILFKVTERFLKRPWLAILVQILLAVGFLLLNLPSIEASISLLINDFSSLFFGYFSRISPFFSAIYCVLLAFIYHYLFLKNPKRISVVLGIFIGASVIAWNLIYVTLGSKVHVGIFIIMGFYILANMGSDQNSLKMPKYKANGYILLAILVVVTLGLSIDHQVKGLDGIKEVIEELPAIGSGGARISGYGTDDEELGHPLEMDDTKVLRVSADEYHYLRGHFRYIYNGRGWLGTHRFQPTTHSASDLPVSYKDGVEYTTVRGEVEVLRGQYDVLFTPGNTKKVELDGVTRLSTSSFKELEVENVEDFIATGDSYVFYSEIPNWDEEYLAKQPRKSERNKIALDLPEGYSKSPVAELVDEIVEGEEGPYNKAKAIERYLRFNYQYSLDVELPAEGQDFVEDFLFNQQKGYCAHFSTAFVVMARLADIEARWVSGFNHGTRDGDSYIIRQRNAHSWPEVYIANAGWVAFEPTPGFRNIARDITRDESDSYERDLGENQHDHIEEGYWDEEGDWVGGSTDDDPNQTNVPVTFIIISLLTGLLAILAVRIIKGKKEALLSNESAVIKSYHVVLKRLHRIKMARSLSETPLEYSNRLNEYPWIPHSIVLRLTHAFEKAYYGQQSIGKSERDEIVSQRKSASIFKMLRTKMLYSLGVKK
ncbi:transglutaminase domain-containing protein [Proteinivorax hydrogeniformans]|uniref:Transglutaminase domain-containing protein n=1 Tax=Proteinivorax hydrogeniformans TaxID=1826727 RepID=A0AAU8HS83_9FIRM